MALTGVHSLRDPAVRGSGEHHYHNIKTSGGFIGRNILAGPFRSACYRLGPAV
jgi:hypothetical protein